VAITEQNYNTIVFSPLEQFEVRNLISFEGPILGDINLSITNIGLYLTIGALIVLTLNILATNYDRIGSNNWSISNECLYATVHSIVVNQINERRGQIYFPFIYTLFIFILINNLIGMVKIRCLYIIKSLIMRQLLRLQQANFSSSSVKSSVESSNGYSNSLHPYFITGFTDGDGCFTVKILKSKRLKSGWDVQLCFQITAHRKDRALLEMIRAYFGGVGSITKEREDTIQYRVSSIKDFNVIINHFDNYPLLTQKQADYLLFKSIVELCIDKEHLTQDGLYKILNARASMNKGISETLKAAFPFIMPVSRPEVKNQVIKDPHWLVGFTDAEGCFNIGVFKDKLNGKVKIRLSFSISQHIRDSLLINSLVSYLGCGLITSSGNSITFYVSNLKTNSEAVIPFFEKYPLQGAKRLDYSDWCKVALLMKNKAHLTESGLQELMLIKEGMKNRMTCKTGF
jgi:hypothetical protein